MPIKVTAHGTMPGGTPWNNVFHFGGPAMTDAEANAMLARVRALYAAARPRLVAAWKFNGIRIRRFNAGDMTIDWQKDLAQDPPDAGTAAGIALPNDLALVISWRSNNLTRQGRGRTYIGGWSDAANEAGPSGAARAKSTAVGPLATAAAAFIEPSGTWPLVVFSRRAAELGSPSTEFSVLRGSIDDRWDTQRRRDEGIATVRTLFGAP